MVAQRHYALIRRFLEDRRGNIAVLFSLSLVPMLAAGALAVDGANAFRQATEMQRALDSAAIAAAVEHGNGGSSADLSEAANEAFWANFYQSAVVLPHAAAEPVLDESLETSRPYVGVELLPGLLEDQVAVEIDLAYEPVFWSRISFPIAKRAVAGRAPDLEACILALAKTAPRAFEVSGSAEADMSGCTITANSIHQEAIYLGGAGALVAECLYASGGIAINSLNIELACAQPREGTPQVRDPFSRIALPRLHHRVDLSGCGQNFVTGGGGNGDCNGTGRTPNGAKSDYVVQLKPGTYSDLEIKGNVQLASGEYLIDGGSLKLTSQSIVSGEGVTFFLMNGADLEIQGGATFHLSPQLEGDWAGFVFVAERGNTSEAIITGNSSSTLTGIIYLPDVVELQFSGNSNTSGECIRIIAQEITLIGNAKFKMDCDPELANMHIQNPGAIRLVE
ncbi:TadE/TadG family type IV pilus assembly protein [Rhizobium sp. EC-SD404]|uniref:TadE/TadG family type IV pilus assembly protein n=1 Tax=Rhizobium sp. EC-SD404 TaxID=2038389 RepID=UPI0012529B81|nr:TadE/TadG family type IV pilus assembly protein [Rhizobium sp. EC-SD404]VVS96315.1 conserved hypothetical protein [Rhizobium sp. EC-SD404]